MRHRQAIHVLSLSCVLLAFMFLSINAYAQGQNYTVDACSDALWKKAIFLRGPSPPEAFTNVTKWKKAEVKTYATTTVLPQARANIAFVVVALITLLVFLLWRLFRRCCMCCCMRQSCEERRSKADPQEILRGWGYWLQKGLLLLLAVAALAMMLAGIITAPKQLFVRVWPPVNRLTSYLNSTTARMDGLVDGLSGINPILDSLVSIVNNDINLPDIKAKLQSIGATLDSSAADPNTVVLALAALNGSMTSTQSQIATLRPQLAPSGLPASLTALQGGLPLLAAVVTACNNYSTRLAALDGPFADLSAATSPPFPTSSLESSMSAVEVDSWRDSLAAMTAALGVWRSFRAGNTLGGLATSLTALNATLADLKSTKAPGAATALVSFQTAWSGVSASLGALLDRITYVEANVARLDPASSAAVQRLRSVYGNTTAFAKLTPSPSSLAGNLSALGGEVSLGPQAGALVTDLNNAQTAIDTVPLAVLDDARAALANLKTALDALSPKVVATNSAIAAFNGDPNNQAKFDAMKSSGVATGNTWDLSKAAKAKADTATANSSVMAVQAAANSGTLDPLAGSAKSGMTQVDAAVAASDASISSRPSLAPYQATTASVKSVYDSLPPQKSQLLASVSSAVAKIENLLVSVPAAVRSQTTSIQAGFGAGVDQLQSKVIVRAARFQVDNDDKVKSFDLFRYRATCALLGVAAAFCALLILVAAINCPWGIGCAVFFLLVLATLLFVLGTLFAVVLVVAQDSCYHTEHVVLDALGPGSTVTPLARYYFFADYSNSSVRAVLKSANLVDVDKVQQQVVGLADGMITDFTAQFSPQWKLATVITDIRTFINSTISKIDDLLAMAGVPSVRPLYLGLKSYPCCEVTDYSAKLWVVLTFGGWLLYVACTTAMAFLGRLDQLPHSGCCGCKPLVGRRLLQRVHPENCDGDEDGGGSGKEGGDGKGGAVQAVVVAPGQQFMPADGGGTAVVPSAPQLPPYGAYPLPMQGYPSAMLAQPPPAAYYPPAPLPAAAASYYAPPSPPLLAAAAPPGNEMNAR